MPELKHDASTNIEELAQRLVDEMNRECAAIRKARLLELKATAASEARNALASSMTAKPPAIPVITFRIGTGRAAARTPAVQAAILVEGGTQICWSAHMLDKARDINMFSDGKYVLNLDRTLGQDLAAIKKAWIRNRTKLGLVDAGGGYGWVARDPLHVELPQSKLSQTDERAFACLGEYARLSRKENKGRNKRFEEKYADILRVHLEKYSVGGGKK